MTQNIWETLQLGPFDTCYEIAKQRGYLIESLIEKGLRLHIPSSPEFATLTQTGEYWELIKYNYRPQNNEPELIRRQTTS